MSFKKKIYGSYKSLTIWFNAVLLASIPVLEYTKDLLPNLQEYLTPETFKLVGLIVLLANIIIRFKTTTSLEEK